MTKSNNLVVHLTTGYAFLKSIETDEIDNPEEALIKAVVIAVKHKMQFSYIYDKDLDEFIKDVKSFNDDLIDMDDDEIMDYYEYHYLDLSHECLDNLWVCMTDTRIDNNIYSNTYTLEDMKK